ncbi:hypothetical protein BDY19DRAFT_317937 [Irpex rosettiformis]|uniref:Uncharacterized protein n=1 Tax=Irpex rosettiformis TaxID=378272 RepID=A0ACB8TY25_9APHY|nr:hypothetical protein BDY19DRAFT_317937 [Irpex rosettiformis]
MDEGWVSSFGPHLIHEATSSLRKERRPNNHSLGKHMAVFVPVFYCGRPYLSRQQCRWTLFLATTWKLWLLSPLIVWYSPLTSLVFPDLSNSDSIETAQRNNTRQRRSRTRGPHGLPYKTQHWRMSRPLQHDPPLRALSLPVYKAT